ncbi:hypothetical protein M426DRAFT_247561 [Hypoxylon sp. CI-4A]|nr:hypothetical protein M426DRAFT_247561 [Hypoxylon sp. CI-4A]
MCFCGRSILNHGQAHKKRRTSRVYTYDWESKSKYTWTMAKNSFPETPSPIHFSDIPLYLSPNTFTPRVKHEQALCNCDHCSYKRLSLRFGTNARFLPTPEDSDDAEHLYQHVLSKPTGKNKGRARANSQANPTTKKTELEYLKKQQRRASSNPVTVSNCSHPHQAMAYPEIYVHPSTTEHVTLPVVNYSTALHTQHPQAWPVLSLAVAPQCSKPQDFEAALCPEGAGLVAVARVAKTKKTMPLSAFRDLDELRRDLIQLEVWDEGAVNVMGPVKSDEVEGEKGGSEIKIKKQRD